MKSESQEEIDKELLDLLILYRLTRVTGIRISELACMDAVEVEVMIAIETARYKYYTDRIRTICSSKSAEAMSAGFLQLILESELLV